jgi:hypothetical protein
VITARGSATWPRGFGRGWARGAVVGLGLLGACAAPEARTLEVEQLPASITHLLVVGLDDSGEVVGGTGVVPVMGARADAFAELPGALAYEVHGFSAAALASVAPLPREEVLRASLVRAARDSEVVLPPATWSVRFDEDGAPSGEVRPRALTADWLPACPRRVPEGSALAMSCANAECTPRLTQVGCALRLDAVSCALGEAEGTVGAREVVLESAELPGVCAEVEAVEGVALSLACTTARGERCRLDVVTATAPPPLEVATAALSPGASFSDPINNPRPPVGFLVGLAPLGREVLVARLDAPWLWWDCRPERRAWVDVVDASSLAVTRTATAPGCTMRGVRDPLGRGLLVLVGGQPGGLALIGPQGQVLRQVLFDAAVRRPSEAPLALVATASRVVVALTAFDGSETSTLIELDLRTLEALDTTTVRDRVEVLGLGVDGEVLVVTDEVDTLLTLDAELVLREPRPLWDLCSEGFRLKPAVLFPYMPTRTLALPSLDDQAQALFLLETSGACAPVVFPGAPRDVTALATWAVPEPDVVLVGLLAARTRGSLALLDVRRRRWVGGELPLGLGPLDLATPDDAGRVWLLAPWTGTLVRVTPRP